MTIPRQPTAAMSPEERRALLAQLLRDKAKASVATVPLSYGQRALYVAQQFAPESAAQNVAFAASVRSVYDRAALRRAFQTVVDRHAALRTVFVSIDDVPMQQIRGAVDLDFSTVDAAGWDDSELRRRIEAAGRQPFDLSNGPLLRVRLFTGAAADDVLLMVVHHIVFDGWSMGIVLDELTQLYAAEAADLPVKLAPAERQYADYVAWQTEMLAGPEGERLREFWLGQFAGGVPVLDLPIDKPRSPIPRMRGGSIPLQFSSELGRKLRALAKAEQTTLYTLVLTAFYILLYRSTGQDDIVVGSPMSGRGSPAFQRTVGYLVSPVPLRVRIAPDRSFSSTLAQVRETLHDAIAHETYPFALLLEQLQPKRVSGRTPIMEVLFTQQKAQLLGALANDIVGGGTDSVPSGAALDLVAYPLRQSESQFDLSVILVEAGDNLSVNLSYNSDLFERGTIARMGGHLLTLLESIVNAPAQPVGALPMLSRSERAQILDAWNDTARPYDLSRCLHQLVEAQVERVPDATAVRFEGRSINYGELNARANRLARHLRELGVGPGRLVGVCAERSLELVVALLATLKAGGAYVPLDPDYPVDRLQFMIGDAAPLVLLTQSSLVDRLSLRSGPAEPAVVLLDRVWDTLEAYAFDNLTNAATADDLAYVMYTSGSTGRPKGVMIPHRAICNHMHWMQETFPVTGEDRVLQKSPFSFDASVWEFYAPLIVGAQLVVARPGGHQDAAYVVRLMLDEQISMLKLVPSLLRLLLDEPGLAQCAALRHVFCGGEALSGELQERFYEQLDAELYNLYGPTEATIDATWWACRPGDQLSNVPIGRPIANTRVYILDRQQQPVPVGVLGELYIGGTAVARGYHNRPELTSERFVRDPFSADPEARLYRTGDLVRYLGDGSIQYLGRLDFQVKLRGFRIELGEIETVLKQHAAVREAVVIAHPDGRGQLRLLAYLVADGETQPQAGQLRLHLRASLPDYMIPAAFIALEHMPMTPSGKVDRRALPLPEAARERGDDGYVAPSTGSELAVAAVWCEVLGVDRVSVYDNFFDLGGHSLSAVETISRLERQLGARLNPALMRTQTLGQLAASYDVLTQTAAAAPAAEGQTQAGQQSPKLAGRLFSAVKRAITPGEK